LGMNEGNDKAFVRRILNGDGQAWAEFVDRYTDWVFYVANQWTTRPDSAPDWAGRRKMRSRKTGKNYFYSEDTLEVYLWLMEQLRHKIKSYTGKRGASLASYVWAVLHSKNLFVDFLRWKHGDPRKIPQALREATERERQVFVLLRMRKTVEQIAAEARISPEEAETLTKNVLHKLTVAGLEDMLLPRFEVALDEELTKTLAASTGLSEEDKILFREFCTQFGKAINELPPEEQLLLKLAYNHELTAGEILENYRLTKKPLPDGNSPEELQAHDIYKMIDKVKKKLLALFREKCQRQTINEETVNAFLDQFGVNVELYNTHG